MARMRMRTEHRAGRQPGQPVPVTTEPERFPRKEKAEHHYCGECFGPRNAYEKRLFCNPCMDKMFSMGSWGYDAFLRSCRARAVRFMNRVTKRRELCDQLAWGLRALFARRVAEIGGDAGDAAILGSADFLESWGQYLRGEVSEAQD
jgi:hypothetical protein